MVRIDARQWGGGVTGRRPRRAGGRRGFTLVEILAVVVILGIASAIIIPQIGNNADLKAQAGARLVLADLTYAQNRAIATQKWHYVKFDVANNRYSVLDSVPLSGGDAIVNHPTNKDPFTTRFAVPGPTADIRIESAAFNGVDTDFRPEFTIAFDMLGTPFVYCYDLHDRDEMLDGTVVIGSGEARVTLRVERYTGEITVQ